MSTPPTLAEIRDRWLIADWWRPDCAEHRVRPGRDHAVLEGLRHARNDIAALLAELDELREDTADMAQARAVADATRKMANDANARLRAELLAALDREDDGRTSLSGYISHLVAQRDALKAALAKAPQVSFCNWCPDPHHPSPAHHPGGQPAHQPEEAR